MFTKGEKAALIITGIEVVVIYIALYAMKRSIANRYGVSIKDLKKTVDIIEKRNELKREKVEA